MHFYWKMFEELTYLGETLVFRDPSLRRCFETWITRNAFALYLAEGYDPKISNN